MKKLLNKLNGSGKFDVDALREEEEHLSGDEHEDAVHYRKSSILPTDPRLEDVKPARRSSLTKKVVSPRTKGTSMENDEKRSSKELHKDRLNESDDKVFKKSFSLKNVTLFNKSTDQLKSSESPAVRSPSLKGMFLSNYGPQKDSLVDLDGSGDEEMNEDAAVPHNRVLGTRDDEDLYSTTPTRVPSASSRTATSPLASPKGSRSSSPAPARTASPRIINSPPGSPSFTAQSSSPRIVPTFTPTPTAPPAQTIKPSPLVLVTDDFDAHFGNMGRARTESITDDYGAPFRPELNNNRDRAESVGDDVDVDLDHELMQDRPKGGLFSSFGTNKPKKLK